MVEHTKICTQRGERKPLSTDFRVARMGKRGFPIYTGQCRACDARKAREWEKQNKSRRDAWRRDWVRRKRESDPEWWSARMAYAREWNRRHRGCNERQGKPTRHTGEVLPVGPFAAWLRRLQVEHGNDLAALAGILDVSLETVRRIINDRQATVDLGTVEAALCAIGTRTIEDLYGSDL